MTEQVGIIGLGIMGGAYAKNLSAAGMEIIGFDVDESYTLEDMANDGVAVLDALQAVQALPLNSISAGLYHIQTSVETAVEATRLGAYDFIDIRYSKQILSTNVLMFKTIVPHRPRLKQIRRQSEI